MRILKVKDIKESLECGIHRAYEIVNQDDFPKIKMGNRVYIIEEEYHNGYSHIPGRHTYYNGILLNVSMKAGCSNVICFF